jgi:putative DNA primase/helicase
MNAIFTDTLQEAFLQIGFELPKSIKKSGFTRFPTNGDRGDTAGWLRVFDDQCGAAFGDHREPGMNYCWQKKVDKNKMPTRAEIEALKAKSEEYRRQAEAERELEYAKAAENAKAILSKAKPATCADDHPYLAKKRINNPHGVYVDGDILLVPIYGPNGLQSIERISADGKDKKGLFNGRKAGGSLTIGDASETIVVCEGYATGEAIHAATGLMTVVAFSAGNLETVAKQLRQNHPGAKLVIAADDDVAEGKPNPGVEAATRAAKASGASVAIPALPNKPNTRKTDFWDFAFEHGKSATVAAINKDSAGNLFDQVGEPANPFRCDASRSVFANIPCRFPMVPASTLAVTPSQRWLACQRSSTRRHA